MIDTKEKIMETAAKLFAEQGYAATSLRQIIAEAGVNLAAVHYHFGSKEELLDELVHRRAEPVNEERMARLERLESQPEGVPPSVNDILWAFLEPTAIAAEQNPIFVQVMGRIHAEGLMPAIVQKHFRPTAERFLSALRLALSDLPEQELQWRVHFMMGAMSQTMCGTPVFALASEDFHSRMRRLVRFLSAGFRAPAEDGEEAK
jgi:AcrR family transcriptional regulator